MKYTQPAHEGEHVVPIGSIRVSTRRLRKLSAVKIRRYRWGYEAGDDFPPIVVDDCGDFYTVRDGRHRYQAQLAAGFRTVVVVIMN